MTVTPQTNATLQDIANVLAAQDDFVLCGHVSPDGDCIGSQLALWHTLNRLGKNAVCVLAKDEPIPASLAFLPGSNALIPAEAFDGDAHTFVGLDVPSRERTGEAAASILDSCDCSLTIDHHATPIPMCTHVYVDPDSASTSIIVWELIKLLVDEPPIESVLCAYAGLVTDTGGFRYQNSDAKAFAAAAELVGKGADPSLVAKHVFQSRTIASIKLEAIVIDRMVLNAEGTYALSWTTEEDMAKLNAKKSDAEPLIDALRSIDGIRVACILRQQDDVTRISLRAKDDTNVMELARELGGGGHRAAAGATLELPIGEAVDFMKSKLDELVSFAEE